MKGNYWKLPIVSVLCLWIAMASSVNNGIAESGANLLFMPQLLKNYISGPGNVFGHILDASTGKILIPNLTGQPLKVCLVDEPDNCTEADEAGEYRFDNLREGWHALTVNYEGYSPGTESIWIKANQDLEKDLVMTPLINSDSVIFRFVLTWSSNPYWVPSDCVGQNCNNDLDSHLWLQGTTPVHLYLGMDRSIHDPHDCTTYPNACLEVDQQNGSGPEALIIRKMENVEYYFGVLNYYQPNEGVPTISNTEAQVKIYNKDGLLETYTVPPVSSIPDGLNPKDLDFWLVFTMNSAGVITPVNCLAYYSGDDPPVCPDQPGVPHHSPGLRPEK